MDKVTRILTERKRKTYGTIIILISGKSLKTEYLQEKESIRGDKEMKTSPEDKQGKEISFNIFL